MKVTHFMTYIMSVIFIIGETARRGINYFSVNATTMIEDYLCGFLLLTAAMFWSKKHSKAPKLMVAAWGYATGGMFVPFFAHLEAYFRGITFRSDHPHEDLGSVFLKGSIWAICLIFFMISLQNNRNNVEDI